MTRALTPWRFDSRLGMWIESPDEVEAVDAKSLTVMTFNVWFSRLWFHERLEAVLRIARSRDVDVIALQEVTPELLEKTLESKWLRDAYWTSDALGETVFPYGNLILTRVPPRRFSVRDLPSRMGRKLVVGELAMAGGDLHVETVHLESYRENAETRARQLELIQDDLRQPDHALLVGDFNFCSSWIEESENLEPDFQDLWPLLNRGDPGYTEDTTINTMRRDVKREHKQVRFDRVVFRGRSSRWRPSSIEIVGKEPVSELLPDVFPSDHFGLVARFVRSS